MGDEPRVLRPDRRQISFELVDLESQVPEDHMARVVWAFVEKIDVSSLEAKIKSREGGPGRPTPDRRLYLALWLYATLDGVGSAREVDRLCRAHIAYRWLCGGVPMNYHDLADFRVEAGEFLDDLLSKSVAALVAQGLVSLDCLAVDGVRVRANAGSGSFRRKATLTELHEEAKVKVASLRSELDGDPGSASKRVQAARLRAASEREAKIVAAQAAVSEIGAQRAKEDKEQRRKNRKRKDPRGSTTDPVARVIKTASGGFRPAYNFQVRTDPNSCIVVGFEATNRASDRGQLTPAVEDIKRRYGRRPKQLLADAGYDGRDDIEHLSSEKGGAIEVFCPLPGSKGGLGDPTPKRGDGPGVIAWRQRMSSEAGVEFYRKRFPTERPHADMRNRGLTRLLVRGNKKVAAIGLWHIIAYNFLQSRFLARRASQVQLAAA
jgi:transposase